MKVVNIAENYVKFQFLTIEEKLQITRTQFEKMTIAIAYTMQSIFLVFLFVSFLFLSIFYFPTFTLLLSMITLLRNQLLDNFTSPVQIRSQTYADGANVSLRKIVFLCSV